ILDFGDWLDGVDLRNIVSAFNHPALRSDFDPVQPFFNHPVLGPDCDSVTAFNHPALRPDCDPKFDDLGVFTRPINNISSKNGNMILIEKHLCDSAGQPLVDFDKSSGNMGATCGSCEEASTDKNYKASAPALVFMGTLLPWMGPGNSSLGTDTAMVTALTFDGFVGDLLTQRLEMSNSGSTVVHFHFRLVKISSSFLTATYVDENICQISVLLPGESVKIRVIFKSKKPGYFSQTWRVLTQPILCGGRTPQVTLKAAIMSRPEDASPIQEIKVLIQYASKY
ncbi:hypothetical protein CHS0354_029179, partial [Potamilus streckersoni]